MIIVVAKDQTHITLKRPYLSATNPDNNLDGIPQTLTKVSIINEVVSDKPKLMA